MSANVLLNTIKKRHPFMKKLLEKFLSNSEMCVEVTRMPMQQYLGMKLGESKILKVNEEFDT